MKAKKRTPPRGKNGRFSIQEAEVKGGIMVCVRFTLRGTGRHEETCQQAGRLQAY